MPLARSAVIFKAPIEQYSSC